MKYFITDGMLFFFYRRFLFDTNRYTKDNTDFNYAINYRVPKGTLRAQRVMMSCA